MNIHSSITWARLEDAMSRRNTTLDNPGFCLACGQEQDGCEPDARGYKCEHCGERQVYAPEEIALGASDMLALALEVVK